MKRTALYDAHIAKGALMVPFAGYEMPLHYGSQIAEHQIVREDVGLFDVSHMTIVDLLGAGGRQCLRHLLANDVDRLQHPGEGLYSCMLNNQGGIIDDLLVYYRAPDNYRLVLNASTREKDLAWIHQHAAGWSLGVQERRDLSMIAIQGPKTIEKLLPLLFPALSDAVSTLQPFDAVDCDEWFVARTGYTGEEGVEIIVPHHLIMPFWQKLEAEGFKPCGLGARDTLRLEAGLLLYGQDMTELTTPYECGLGWTVSLEHSDRDFIGRAALALQKAQGVKRQFVGLWTPDKVMLRSGQKVRIAGGGEGVITSGSFSPILQKSIAFARIPKGDVTTVEVEVRHQWHQAFVTKPRFVKQGKSLLAV